MAKRCTCVKLLYRILYQKFSNVVKISNFNTCGTGCFGHIKVAKAQIELILCNIIPIASALYWAGLRARELKIKDQQDVGYWYNQIRPNQMDVTNPVCIWNQRNNPILCALLQSQCSSQLLFISHTFHGRMYRLCWWCHNILYPKHKERLLASENCGLRLQ